MRYDDQTRQQARQLYEQGGTFRAARELGVSARTIREWAQQGGWATSAAAQAEQAARSAAAKRTWQVRRRQLADEAGEAAEAALARLRERLAAGRIAGIRDLAHSFALLVDRAEQLTASAGGWEQPDVTDQQQIAHLELLIDAAAGRNGDHAG